MYLKHISTDMYLKHISNEPEGQCHRSKVKVGFLKNKIFGFSGWYLQIHFIMKYDVMWCYGVKRHKIRDKQLRPTTWEGAPMLRRFHSKCNCHFHSFKVFEGIGKKGSFKELGQTSWSVVLLLTANKGVENDIYHKCSYSIGSLVWAKVISFRVLRIKRWENMKSLQTTIFNHYITGRQAAKNR